MQNRNDWTCYTSRIKKGSFFISIFLHVSFFSLIFIPVKEKRFEREIFVVKLIELPNIEVPQKIIKPELEQVSLPKTDKKQNFKKEELKTESKIKIEKTKEMPTYFSAEDYKQKIYSKIAKEEKKDNVSSKVDVKIPEIKSSKVPYEEDTISLNTVSSIPDWYINLIKRKIEEKWAVKDFFLGLSAVVSFRIDRDGKVESIIIEKTSGYKKFDNSIIDAIKSVEKWPEFPKEIKDRYLDVVIEFKTEG